LQIIGPSAERASSDIPVGSCVYRAKKVAVETEGQAQHSRWGRKLPSEGSVSCFKAIDPVIYILFGYALQRPL